PAGEGVAQGVLGLDRPDLLDPGEGQEHDEHRPAHHQPPGEGDLWRTGRLAVAHAAIVPVRRRTGQAAVRTSPSPSTARSTATAPPSVTSLPISIRESGSPMACWMSRRSGRAPYAGS